jgi:hypothetical protein
MKKVFLMFVSAVVFCTAAHADDLKVSPFLRLKMTSDFVSDQTGHDFEISGVKIEKDVTDNLAVAVTPGFLRASALSGTTTANNTLDFFLVEGYFKINDLTSTYGDYGLALTAGQYIAPFHKMEQYYQPYMFVMRPIDFRMMPNNYGELGVMLSQSFFDDMIMANLAYSSGAGIWNPTMIIPNTGALILTATFFPFKTMDEVINELSLTVNVKSVLRATERSNYNFLLGYKYAWLATSLEFLKTYSSDRLNDISALSFGLSADVYGPFQAMARWDYSDDNALAPVTGSRYDHDFLVGINTKWFDDKLQAAVTYDQSYDPQAKTTKAKRIMLATQFCY